jgi:hypothetical protein
MSKQTSVKIDHARAPLPMPNGNASWIDFTGSDLHRFRRCDGIGKNRIVPPTKIVHFFNCPLDFFVESDLVNFFEASKAPKPVGVKIFTRSTPSDMEIRSR